MKAITNEQINNGFMDFVKTLEQTERGNGELKRIIKLARRNNK